MKFDWNKARAFLVTAEEGSLSAAARALGMAQPTLGRQVDGLEQELGIVLFERVGRGLTLTPSGVELLEHVRFMGEAAGRVSLAALANRRRLKDPSAFPQARPMPLSFCRPLWPGSAAKNPVFMLRSSWPITPATCCAARPILQSVISVQQNLT